MPRLTRIDELLLLQDVGLGIHVPEGWGNSTDLRYDVHNHVVPREPNQRQLKGWSIGCRKWLGRKIIENSIGLVGGLEGMGTMMVDLIVITQHHDPDIQHHHQYNSAFARETFPWACSSDVSRIF